jgi:mRNA interferase RelE/StbE
LKVLYNKKFLKDLAALPSAERSRIEKFAFDKASNAKSFRQLEHLEKLTGYKTYYKVRFGNYRVGLQFKDDTLTFERVLHRKEIYRFFPE